MKKEFIRLNIDDNYLSLGNLFRCIKEESVNNSSALQVELFCTLFDVDYINDTTVNNYCTGCRGINNDYRQIFIGYRNKYEKDSNVLLDNICNLISIVDGNVYNFSSDYEKLNCINGNARLKRIMFKLYNISKNDKDISENFSNFINNCLYSNNLYGGLIKILFFVILEKKQPIYVNDLKKEIIENILRDTSISASSLEEYLNLKFSSGINYDYSLRKLANENNPYACFELGVDEYNGYIKDRPRYDISYKYLKKASEYGHPAASYMIANMYYKEIIGSHSNEDLDVAYKYLEKAINLGNVAAINTKGILYLNGIYPCIKDIDKAIECFKKACLQDYVYSYNNLGKIYEDKNDFKEAYNYYLKSANLNESWACNKIGEFYRKGIFVSKDYKKAIHYYSMAIEAPSKYTCYYAYYNLAKYFYLNGCGEINVFKDVNKAIEYFEIASDNDIIDAMIELVYIYSKMYLSSNLKEYLRLVKKYVNRIESHNKYNDEIRIMIESKLKELVEHRHINISFIDGK